MNKTMTPADIAAHAQWKPSSGHPKGWRVTRQFFGPNVDPMLHELKDKRGRVILFKSFESARRRANALNKGA